MYMGIVLEFTLKSQYTGAPIVISVLTHGYRYLAGIGANFHFEVWALDFRTSLRKDSSTGGTFFENMQKSVDPQTN